jgi:hypothetical protein
MPYTSELSNYLISTSPSYLPTSASVAPPTNDPRILRLRPIRLASSPFHNSVIIIYESAYYDRAFRWNCLTYFANITPSTGFFFFLI